LILNEHGLFQAMVRYDWVNDEAAPDLKGD